MADPNEAALAKGEVAPEDEDLVPDTTEEGRYIPYSGGSLGWFENSGVLKSEVPNNYLFHTLMASDVVRSKQFQRWGERFNRRGDRERYKRLTRVAVTFEGNSWSGTTRDLSRHGVRLQLLEDHVSLQQGDVAKLTIYEAEDSDEIVLECEVRVVWSQSVGKIRSVWILGMTLEALSPEQEEAMRPLLREY